VLDLVFGIIKTDAHQVDNAIKKIGIDQSCAAVGGDAPLCLLQRTVIITGSNNQRVVFAFALRETRKRALVSINGVGGLLLFCLLVIVIVELVERTVGTAISNESRTACKTDCAMSGFHTLQSAVF
jgi:hypothetical protein